MANPGMPTSTSHGHPVTKLADEFNGILVHGERLARNHRLDMAGGPVGDDKIKELWDNFAQFESRLLEIRKATDFHDQYARYRSLSFEFNCTDDINAATDKIINLPANHKWKTDHRVDFRILEGSLPGGLSEDTNYWVRTVDKPNGTVTLTATEGGGTDINLTNATGRAIMILNIKPDYSSMLTAVDAVLDEIELNLVQRATTYSRATLSHTPQTRSTTETATLRTKLSDFEALVDIIEA